MKNFLGKYSDAARVALTVLAGLLVTFGFLTTASAQLAVGAAISFGVAFWKLYDILVKGETGTESFIEVAKILFAALATVLLTFGLVDSATVQFWSGAALSVAVSAWTMLDAWRKTKI